MVNEITIKKKTVFLFLGIIVIGIFLILAFKNIVAGKAVSDTQLVQGGEQGSNKLEVDGTTQVINLGIANYNYDPVTITVKANQPVKIVGNMDQLQGCLRAFTIPKLGVSKVFRQGDNVIEFTPKEKGTFGFTCSMGMGRGTLIVE